jgi:predicted GNAT superfamily acetyltransferase
MISASQVEIRPCHGLEEFEACAALEKLIWESPDIEVVPAALFAVTPETGGQVLGAFDRDRLIGFVLAFGACREGAPGRPPQAYLHSHMTAVLPEYRDLGIGRNLKLFQRQEALSRGIDLVEWTFDPLELRNAYFNLVRLGAIVRRFIPNLYGITASPLHSYMPTDRFVAEWWLSSPRVEAIVAGRAPEKPFAGMEKIDVPSNISDIKLADREEAVCIQTRVREQAQHWFARGYAVTGIERHGELTRYILQHSSGSKGISHKDE